MLTLLFNRILPGRLARLIQAIAEVIDEAHALRLKMTRTHRIGFDS